MTVTDRSAHQPVCPEPLFDGRLRYWVVTSLVVFMLVKGWLSYTRYFNQDEFETLHQGWLIHQGAVQFRDFQSNHPPLAFELLGWLNYVTDDPRTLLRLGRTATWLAAVLTLGLVAWISQLVYGGRAAAWSVVVYAWNATFWEWSSEIRTDFLLVPLWLAAMGVLLSERPRKTAWRMLIVGLLLGTAFWVNQKAILPSLPVGLYLLRERRPWQERRRALLWVLAGGLLPTLLVVGRIWSSGAWDYLVQHNFVGAWALVQQAPYAGFRRFTLWAAWNARRGFRRAVESGTAGRLEGAAGPSAPLHRATALWMLATLLLTPGPFPYYLLSVFPLFAVLVAGWLARCQPRWIDWVAAAPSTRRWLITAAVVWFALFPLLRLTRLLRPTNRYQIEVLGLAHTVTDSTTPVFDGAGSLMTRPDAYPFHWVLWESERRRLRSGQLPPLVATLRQNGCRLVIDTYRLHDLPPAERAELDRHFVSFWGPIRLPGWDSQQPVGRQPVRFELWYDGLYEANRPDVLLDDQPLSVPRRLAAGWHTVSLGSGAGRVQLRDTSRTRHLQLPPDVLPATLFLGTFGYTY